MNSRKLKPNKLNPDNFHNELARWLCRFLMHHVQAEELEASKEALKRQEIERAAVQEALNATNKVSVRRILERVMKGRLSLVGLFERGLDSRYHKEARDLIREYYWHDPTGGNFTPWMVAMYEIENEADVDPKTALCGDWPLSEERLRIYLASGGKWESDLGLADSNRETDKAIARLDWNEPFKNRLLKAVWGRCPDEAAKLGLPRAILPEDSPVLGDLGHTNKCARISVEIDEARERIIIGGEEYDVPRQALLAARHIIRADGAWFSGKNIWSDPEARPDKDLNRLPGEVRTCIEGVRGKGYRLKPEYSYIPPKNQNAEG